MTKHFKMAQDKIKCIVNGKPQLLTPAAYKMAKRFFGAVSEEDAKLAKPVELQRPLMKPVIIKPPMKQPEVVAPPEGDPMAEVPEATEEKTGDPLAELPDEPTVDSTASVVAPRVRKPTAKRKPKK